MEYEFNNEKYCIIDTLDYYELLCLGHQVGKYQIHAPDQAKDDCIATC